MTTRKILVAASLVGLTWTVYGCEPEDPAATAAPGGAQSVPLWEQPIPPGTELVEDGAARINVAVSRRNRGQQSLVVFEVSEEHGYMVDGIQVAFWYRYRDSESGEWVDDPQRILFYIRDRLMFNDTLVAETALIALEFEHLTADLPASTDENWAAEVHSYQRAMREVD